MEFGKDIAQFRQLTNFLALVSIVLWSGVIISLMLRYSAYLAWYRTRLHKRRLRLFRRPINDGIDEG